MSEQLYQKYRPRSLDAFVGNNATIASIRNIVASTTTRPRCYLFSGPSGCGKTSLARVTAKALTGGDFKLIELNAASTRGIDTIRELIATTEFPPMDAQFLCILFDEAHQLTTQAQECLLKVIEDTPTWCYWFLCTTVASDLIPTVQNRCSHFILQPLPPDALREIVLVVADLEQITIHEDVVNLIVQVSAGCPRSALINLEKVRGLDRDSAFSILYTAESVGISVEEFCRLFFVAPRVHEDQFVNAYFAALSSCGGVIELKRRIFKYFDGVIKNPTRGSKNFPIGVSLLIELGRVSNERESDLLVCLCDRYLKLHTEGNG